MPDSYGLVRGSEIDEDDAEVFGLSELDLGDLDLRFEKDSYGRVRFFVYKDDTFITDLEGPIDQAQIDMINPDNPEFIPDPGEAQRPGPDTSGDPEDPTVVDPDNVPKDADVVARRRREADFLNSSTHATGEIPVESTGEIHNDFNEVDNAEPGSKSDESTDFDEDAGDSEDEDAEKISDILDGNVGDVNSRIDELADEAEYELIEAVRDAEVSGKDRSGIKDNIDYLLSEKNNNPKVILAGNVDEVNEYLDDLDLSDEDQKEQFDRVVDAEKGSDEPRVGIIDHADQLESAADESGD